MKTVLLEGSDLSGKTTLIELMKQQLSQEGFSVRVNSGPINPRALRVSLPLKIARGVKIPSVQELMYTLSLSVDYSPVEQYSEDFFIQERSFPSVMAYSRVFNSFGINRFLGGYLRRSYGSFDYNFLIRADVESKLKRIKERKNKSRLDMIIEKNPELIVNLDIALQQILSKEKNYFEVNTTKITPQEACQEIIRRIK